MVVQFSYGFTADGANRDLSFLDWGTFRRWIATDCDRPFFESTCFYESRNSTGIIFVFYFSNLSSFSFSFFVWHLVEGRFQKLSCIADSTRCGCVCLFRCSNFFVFSKSVSLYCIRLLLVPHLKSHRAGEFNFILFHIQ